MKKNIRFQTPLNSIVGYRSYYGEELHRSTSPNMVMLKLTNQEMAKKGEVYCLMMLKEDVDFNCGGGGVVRFDINDTMYDLSFYEENFNNKLPPRLETITDKELIKLLSKDENYKQI